MNEQSPFTFVPAQPKGQQGVAPDQAPQQVAPVKRTRRTKEQMAEAAPKPEPVIDSFTVFNKMHDLLLTQPKPVRGRILEMLAKMSA